MRKGDGKGYLFVVVSVFGFACDSASADSGCIGKSAIKSNQMNLLNPEVLRVLSNSWESAKGIVPPPYDYAIRNTSTEEYAIYTISAKYVQSSDGTVTVSPVFAMSKKGATKGGLPQASTWCPKAKGLGNLSLPGASLVRVVPIAINPSPALPPSPFSIPTADIDTPVPVPPLRDCSELRCAKSK